MNNIITPIGRNGVISALSIYYIITNITGNCFSAVIIGESNVIFSKIKFATIGKFKNSDGMVIVIDII